MNQKKKIDLRIKNIYCGFILLLLSLNTPSGSAQVILGTVRDGQDNKPLKDVNITVLATPYGTTSDREGMFRLSGLTSGRYIIKASIIGYKAVTTPVTLVADSTVMVPFLLAANVLQLRAVEVVGQKYRDPVASPREESPALQLATSTVTNKQVQKQGAKTLIDAIQYIPGALVETRGRKVKQFFSVRGQKYPYPEYAVNGIWQREFHEMPYFFSSSNIEKIEIVRSSAALLTGLSGMTGVVKITTKQVESTEISHAHEYGTFGSYQTRLFYGAKIGRVSYAAGLGIQGTQGPSGKNSAERMTNFYSRVDWQPSTTMSVHLNLFHLQGKRELAQAEPPADVKFQDAVSRFDPYRATLVNVKTFYRPNPKTATELLLYYTDRAPTFVTESEPSDITSSERDHEFGLNVTQAFTLAENNVLRVGGLYNRWVAPNGKRFYVGRKADLQTVSAVVVDEHTFGRWQLDGGLRWAKTYIGEYGAFNIDGVPRGFAKVEPISDVWQHAILNGSAGVTYYFYTPLSIHLNVAAGQVKPMEGTLTTAFEKPKNEMRVKLDIGLQTRIQNLGLFTITGFMVRQNEAIVLSGETVDQDGRILELYLNRDQQQLGVELEARFLPWFNRVECFVNTTILSSRFSEDGRMKTNAEYPNFLANAGLYYTHGPVDFNVFCKYISSFESTRFAAGGQSQPLGDFLALNTTAGWTFGRKFRTRLYLEIHNLTDSRYSTVVGYPDFGRRLIVGLSQDIK